MVSASGRVGRIASLVTAGTLLVSACSAPVSGVAGIGGSPPPEPTVAERTSTSQSRPEAVVRKGTIQDTIRVLGRVVSSQEADLYFRTANRLRAIFVETGQEVKAGDPLAELETGDLLTRIAKAKATLDAAQIAYDKAKAKGVIDDTSSADAAAVETAQIALDQAALQVQKLQQGALDSDVKSAEAGVAQAVAALDKARVDLATKQAQLESRKSDLQFKLTGATPDQVAAAQADVESKRIAVEKVSSVGPKPEDVQQAQIKLEQAKTKLAQVRDAPPVKQEDIAAAELSVRAAEIKLEQVRATNTGTAAQHEADVRTAELNVEAARNKLDALNNQQPNPWDVRLAEQAVTAAQNDLAKVQATPSTYDAKAAQVAYDLAVAKLQTLQAGPTDADVTPIKNEIASLELAVESAKTAVPSAEAAVTAAQAKLQSVMQGPNDLDIRDAQAKVDKAQVDLDRAKAQQEVNRQKLGSSVASNGFDLQSLQKDVDKAKLDLDQLQANYDDARILAPYDGKITKVNGKPGDNVQAFNPVVSISSPANLLIQAQINETDSPKLAVGQPVLISLDAFPGQTINGKVQTLPSSVVTQQGVVADKNTRITVDWTRPGAQIGMNARLQIIVQKKDDTLLVPTQAIRTVGKRRFVEYMDGNVKRSRNVEIGISTDSETEIVSGLDEGMTILAGA